MVAAFSLLLQACFAMPLALRMTAEAVQWSQIGAIICTATMDGASANDHHPAHQLPAHNHAQCLICQAHALPLSLLAVVLCVLLVSFGQTLINRRAAGGPVWRRDRYQFYRSRAPPVAA